ncbi:MAG: tRNA-dihydrouridine synthase family protein [Phycisphaerales bacterium]|nr:tRNA-dihydrouridine synthase family protein [Phycisphaerales bacterium]
MGQVLQVDEAQVLRECRVGPFVLKTPAMQAGLAGYSDMAMRVVARRRGCPYAVTEALLDQVLLRGGRGRKKGTILRDEDHPVAGQLIGSDGKELAAAAKVLLEAGFDGIDLNFACPVRKVVGRCRGGYLLSDPDGAIEILRRVREAVPEGRILSVKLRRALNETPEAAEYFEQVFAEACRLEFAAIAVHGRTVEQKYTGFAKWPFLAELKKHMPKKVTLFGSGDVFTAEDALRMYKTTSVDGIWIARGAIGNPWIFREFAALSRGESLPDPPTIFEQREALLEHFAMAVEIYGEELASRQMRKIGIKYAKLHPNGPRVWREFIAVKRQRDWDTALMRHYAADGPGVRIGSVPDAEDVCKRLEGY